MPAYYNEWEPYPAAWLRNLIAAGHIAPGDVDERSITEVKPDDIKRYTQCHFFAGIGGWAYALRLAGWSDDRSVWTGSCPCQPFSVAGKQKAQQDERHLWPAWFRLIRQQNPATIFGEQVAGAIAHGWLDDAFDDLEGQGYETAACVLPACSVGAPHKRDRLWFVADATQQRIDGSGNTGQNGRHEFTNSRSTMANTNDTRPQRRDGTELPECAGEQFTGACDSYNAANPTSGERREPEAGHTREMLTGGSEKINWPDWSIESGICGVANGIPARVGKLRALGNAIVPALAAEFIQAYMSCKP